MGAELRDVVEAYQVALVHAGKALAQKLAKLAQLHVRTNDLALGFGACMFGCPQVDLDDATLALDVDDLLGINLAVVAADMHPDGFCGIFLQV